MIPSLCRHILPRTATVVAHHSPLVRPAVVPSIQEVSASAARRYYSPLDGANPASTSTNDDDKKPAGLSRDAIADIISDEYGLKLAESKRIVVTVFDTIVEVRFVYNISVLCVCVIANCWVHDVLPMVGCIVACDFVGQRYYCITMHRTLHPRYQVSWHVCIIYYDIESYLTNESLTLCLLSIITRN